MDGYSAPGSPHKEVGMMGTTEDSTPHKKVGMGMSQEEIDLSTSQCIMDDWEEEREEEEA